MVFFFQAEDGIRDIGVTGVQTCALPIWIPPGRVSTYGAIGRLVGIGPRRVARALSQGGGAVPWHRVVRADGSVAEPVRVEQMELLAAEGVPARNGRIDMAAVGWP